MKRQGAREWKNMIVENGSYKLVALFVTLILWVTILGRRDFVLSKEMDIEFLLPSSIAVAPAKDPNERRVIVKVSGPRTALKRFAQNPGTITIDLGRNTQPGPVRAVITPRSVEVPFGVKVMSVTPDVVNVTLTKAVPEGTLAPTSPTPSESDDESAERQ